MRLPMRSWKNTLGRLGLRVKEPTPRLRKPQRFSLEALETRIVMARDFSPIAANVFIAKSSADEAVEVPVIPVETQDKLTIALAKVSSAPALAMDGGNWHARFSSAGNLDFKKGDAATRPGDRHNIQGSVVVFEGLDDIDDTLSLDFSTLPRLANGKLAIDTIFYHGGDRGFDTIHLSGGDFQSVTYSVTGRDSGILEYDDLTVVFSGLEPIVDLTTAATITINGLNTAETIYAEDSSPESGLDTIRVREALGSFEMKTFANKGQLIINGNGGADAIHLDYTRPATGLTSVVVDGGTGNDTIYAGVLDETLIGGTGSSASDTYVFSGSGNFGTDTITEPSGGGSLDTLDFSGLAFDSGGSGVAVDLAAGNVSASGNGVTLSVSIGTYLEYVIGSDNNDTLTANALNNDLTGGEGDDVYVFAGEDDLGSDEIFELSGEGNDTIDFSGLETGIGTGITANLSTGSASASGNGVTLSVTLGTNLENIVGTDSQDTLTGSAAANRLEGRYEVIPSMVETEMIPSCFPVIII